MRKLPSGTVTFFLSDIEGSTRLLDEVGAENYAQALAEHRRVMREAFAANGGVEVGTEGDSFFVAFPTARGALSAAGQAQSALMGGPIRVRMGIHSGEPLLTDEGYVGIDVHRAARVMSAGHGGQVLVSHATYSLLDGDSGLVDLGRHRLKDLTEPQPLYQLGEGEFPSLKTLNQTNLPVQPTPLVGREAELAEVLGLLGESRLVTLTGAGGSGKTRLALQAAAELVDEYEDGVWWVSLAALRNAELVEPTITQVVGAKNGLAEHLRAKKTLLLLDNLEQLLEAAPRIAELLADAPELRVLATSRERLMLSAEQEYPVPTLVPAEAVALFTAGARRLKPRFDPDEDVEEICRRLDGLPLALELAAARIKVLTAAQILQRLGHSLDLLTTGTRDAPARQQTLRAAIAWSYDLLSSAEKHLFARLSVFAGGWTLEAAEEVAAAEVDTLQSLVEKSLVRFSGERYWMLETIREYAFELLERSESADALRLRHLGFFTEFAERAHAELRGPNKAEWLERLQADLENSRAGLAWRPDTAGPAELQLRLAAALRLFWDSAGSSSEGRRWIEEGLARVDAPAPELRYEAYIGASAFASQQRDFEQAFEYDELALAAARELDDPTSIATALMRTAIDARLTGQLPRARELYEKAREYAERDGNIHLAGAITHNLGDLALYEGDFQRARDLFHDALRNARARSDPHETAYALCNIALASFRLDRAEVSDCLREALTILATLSWPVGVAYGVELVGDAIGTDDAEGAARLFAAAEAMRSQLEVPLDTFEQQLHDESLALVLASVPAEQFRAISDEGRLMTAEEAISYGLERLDASGLSRS